jgi:hypothetical protein
VPTATRNPIAAEKLLASKDRTSFPSTNFQRGSVLNLLSTSAELKTDMNNASLMAVVMVPTFIIT